MRSATPLALIAVVVAFAVPVSAEQALPEALAITADYAATRERMIRAGFGELAAADRTFLAFDPAGDGRAIEVVGDLTSARRIVVLVPGVDTTLRDFDRGLGGVARRAPSVQARALRDAIKAPDVAVVAWLGYDPPEGLGLAVIREDRAVAGAEELRRFVSTLSLNATVVIVAHSYGTVVMGLAAASGLPCNVTDLVALASPGLGADFTSGARLWSATSENDWIRRVPHVSIAGFGHGTIPPEARPLPTEGVAGHDFYLTPDSSTLRAIADLVTAATTTAR